MTLFTTAMDERIKCAVVSCYLNSFGAFALDRGNFCGAQIPPRLLADGDMSDVASLIGPRPLLVESGIRDTGFPIEASREPAAAVRRYYQVAGSQSGSMWTSSTQQATGGADARPTTG